MMRLWIGNTPATACVIFSARLRRLPLQVVPPSVTLPLATDTDTPKGAIATLMCSTSAELIFASRNLLASAGPRREGVPEPRAFGQLANCVHAGVDRQPVGVQHDVVEPSVLLLDIEIG